MIKITNTNEEKKGEHSFGDYYAFVDDQDDFFIIGRDDTVIMLTSDTFEQFNYSGYATIEDFCSDTLDSKLVKAFGIDDFDIEVKIK